jgi:hypothetical protein
MTAIVRAFESRHLSSWAFEHYLAIAPASFVGHIAGGSSRAGRVAVAGAR